MTHSHPYQKAIETLPHEEQLRCLYEYVITSAEQAKDALEKETLLPYEALRISSQIICGLRMGLDHENHPEAAASLDQFYAMIDGLLLAIPCNEDSDTCQKIITHMQKLKTAWKK